MRVDARDLPRGRTVVLLLVVAGLGLGLGGPLAAAVQGGDADVVDRGEELAPSELPTATVERRDLVRREELAGTLGHGAPTVVHGQLAGTITALPEVGDLVSPGEALHEVDERGVVLLAGTTPMWRPLGPGVPDGRDVAQLERNLRDLGYADDVTVDDDWTAATTRAVRAWQEDLGLTVDGRIELGRVVFAPGAVRIADVPASTGGEASGPVLEVTTTEQLVTTAIASRDRDLLAVGDEVDVVLPDGTTVPGTVTTVAAGPDEEGRYPVSVALERSVDLPDGTALEVVVARPVAEDVLAVPVAALVALLEGGHAVERVTAGGGTELVAVDLGASVDGWVQVTGDVAAGDTVVTA